MATCDFQSLLSQACAAGLQNYSWQQLAVIEDALLCQIQAAGGGGGGSGAISSGAIDPVAAPTNPAIDNFYVNTASAPKTGWFWPAGGGAWAQIF